MRLDELFNQPLPWKNISRPKPPGAMAVRRFSFNAGENLYEVWISGNRHWSIQFDLVGIGHGIYNTGHAFEVFTTVIDIIKTSVVKELPDTFSFSARTNQPSRVKLYKRMVESLGKDIQDYVFSFDDDSFRDLTFNFTRKDFVPDDE